MKNSKLLNTSIGDYSSSAEVNLFEIPVPNTSAESSQNELESEVETEEQFDEKLLLDRKKKLNEKYSYMGNETQMDEESHLYEKRISEFEGKIKPTRKIPENEQHLFQAVRKKNHSIKKKIFIKQKISKSRIYSHQNCFLPF